MRRALWYACVCVLALTMTDGPRAAAGDIVLYATDASNLQGNWTRASDASAAGGQVIASADRGSSSTDNASSAPADAFDFTFSANANTPYRVWFRLRAAGNSKFNDSLFAQFSDAINSSGSAIYRIGTTNGLTLNLQSCNGCPLAGWGWLDGAYWLSQTTTIRFATSGSHTLRVQTREDGVMLDQVVLSPSAYLNAAPGQVMNDSTIVAKGGTPTSSATPFLGSPAAIPGTVLAQNFDNGGEGVSYHDTTSGNSGGAYRQTGVDLEPSSDGGNDVGWIAAGEWLNYAVNVAASGSYTATFRVASAGQGGTFHLEMNGANVSGAIAIPNTGDWQAWTSVTKTVTLNAGAQTARLVMDSAGPGGSVGNITKITFAAAGGAGGGTGGGSSSTPFSGSPVALPGTIDAAKFDNGGEGVAYHDTTAGNDGGAFRSTGVDLENSSDGGVNIGWIAAGEWTNYTVTVASAGSYTAQLRVSSPSGGALHVGFNGSSSVWSAVSVPATGGWQSWTTVNVPVTLGAGTQQLTLAFDTGGFNVRAVTVVAAGGGSTPPPQQPPPTSGGNTINVGAGGNLQAAIDSAQPGDTILLTPGATYRGIFNLPVKGGNSYITIRSAASDSSLPGAGVRITPQYAGQLPKIQGGVAGAPAFITSPGAHHYRLQFLEISSTYAANQIVELGSDSQNALSQVPHDLVIDRCYIHGDPSNGQKRGIALNSAATWIVNSYISDIKSSQEDSQAIASWNGPGPYTIENNFLEAAGENLLFGGADPAIPNLIASDISIRFNSITKRTSWRGSAWTVKNLIELKNAQRVVIDGNVIENCWAAAQSGYAIVFTPRNQDGTAPWSVVQHVQFTNNIVRHISSGFNILGLDDSTFTVTNDIVVRNNLFEDISASRWGGAGQLVVTQGGSNVVFDHNTVFTDGNSVVYADVTTVTGFVFTNNIVPDNAWAIMGGSVAEGNGTLAAYYPGAVFRGNVLIGANSASYPANNFFPATSSQVGFVDLGGGNYRLSSSSAYQGRGTDGLDPGVNMDALRP